ncbi:NAD(P)H-hydrate dehydratase [Pararhizobium mangrovi]|uniref:Bifunctional NAD(P)H-hydrate repair enzyme n=1 Tax=Pararhizobium mangrovi TaxID=2590452 RepID=A0A506UEC4_9HYPH|nr:NAD(P)H-hydrate dehydratase [Pararhizobium mangrovi]TPW31314.1 NAD(P)H-hydrate dehydratase [Pararhizobium mangrovi]
MSGPLEMLVTPQEMGRIDHAAAASGIDSYALMRAAGTAVAARLLARFPHVERVAVLCGPGNNGGDGYVAARACAQAGVPVVVHSLGDPAKLEGDARHAFDDAGMQPQALADYHPQGGDVVVDALFGAGLSRAIEGEAADCIDRIGEAATPVVAIDLPSGVGGDSGAVLGTALQAVETVTFFARKPGHLLMPGRDLCGTLSVVDIGIPARYASLADSRVVENTPALWQHVFPHAQAAGHKFARGHLGVFSGPMSATGAARLSAEAGLTAGAGLVTVASSGQALAVNAAHLTAVMVKRVDTLEDVRDFASDNRMKAFVLGPGFGVGAKVRDYALALRENALVLDADGITAFAEERPALAEAFSAGDTRLVVTPHAGEFARLFPDFVPEEGRSKLDAARLAAAAINAIVVFKGSDTVIAAPDGRAAINTNAPPWLATAGAGDVLSGITGGLLSQSMPAFEAAAAAVWLHGEAARHAGPGMTADDLPQALARVQRDGLFADRRFDGSAGRTS